MNTKKLVWLTMSCLIVLVLVLSSCSKTTTTQTTTPTEVKGTVTQPTTTKTTTNTTASTNTTSSTTSAAVGQPKYGGVFNFIQSADTRTFDDCYVWMSQAWTLSLTNEAILIGDWARGPAGTNETTWAIATGFATMERFETHGLAETYEIDPTGNSITFHIRQGVYFHNKPPTNGRLMDANDVAWSLLRNYNHPSAFMHTSFPSPVSVTATDKWTVVVKFAKFADLTQNIAEMTTLLSIWPKEAVLANNNDMRDWRVSVGTGSFMMTDYVKGSSATFVRNPNYWDKDPIGPGKGNQLPYLDGVKVLIIPDVSTQMSAIRTGKADLGRFSWDMSASLKKTNPEMLFSKYLDNSVQSIGMREDNPTNPWNNLKVRQAMMMAIDYKSIVANYYGGEAEWYDFPTAPNLEYKDMQVPFDQLPQANKDLWTYSPDKAKQ
jgi:ABC-type transport system substrate-binding protein